MLHLVLGLLAGLAVSRSPGPQPRVVDGFTVVLDPGHGGDNSGCHGADGSAEKDVNLAVATAVRQALRHRLPHARVHLTRETDRTVALAERVAFANDLAADVFISIHMNASVSRDQQGYETYVAEPGMQGRAVPWGQGRNPAVFGTTPSSRVARAMVADLGAQAHRFGALALARDIQVSQRVRFLQRVDRGVKTAPFDVLYGVSMAAVLFEAGFLDHSDEGPWLRDPGVQGQVAEGLAEAIVQAYRRRLGA